MEYTKLLLHMDEDPIVDSSPSSHTITEESQTGRSATQSKFGGYSLFVNNSGEYIVSVQYAHADWNWGSDNWTVECWYYPLAQAGAPDGIWSTLDQGLSAGINFAMLGLYTRVYLGGVGYVISGSVQAYTINQWNHMVLQNDGTYLTVFSEGTKIEEWQHDGSLSITNPISAGFVVGQFYNNNNSLHMYGYLDELRVSKGIARYSRDGFTPPTQAFGAAPTPEPTPTLSNSGVALRGVTLS